MHPKDLSIKNFTYTLPENRIANYPLAERDSSKLLIYKNDTLTEDIYRHLATHIPSDSLLIFNNTKVIAARLLFQKESGGVIEIFCLEPATSSDISTAMLQQEKTQWRCLVGGASKWKHGLILTKKINKDKEEIILNAYYIQKETGSFIIEFSWTPSAYSFAEILHFAGAIPLPPYIKRSAEASDAERYQTIYAQQEGSVAAPTAGLHFTDNIFKTLKEKNIQTDFVTLHVGAGTFKPVKSETMAEHDMHAEFIEVNRVTIENLLAQSGKNIIAVGTTSLRTLESLYWLGVKMTDDGWRMAGGPLTIDQWEAYDLNKLNISPNSALKSLLKYLDENKTDQLVAKTQIIIAPGYTPRIVKGLITNFHQPQSTLLLLIAALIGENWRKLYDYALKNDFRFLSYGDGCLIWI
ncbi:MAG: S-adenosylmethionine:tRNA ribosyltransferase-isomerase [Chitinophagaceae bacterium]